MIEALELADEFEADVSAEAGAGVGGHDLQALKAPDRSSLDLMTHAKGVRTLRLTSVREHSK
jgi:hypothetical protein